MEMAWSATVGISSILPQFGSWLTMIELLIIISDNIIKFDNKGDRVCEKVN